MKNFDEQELLNAENLEWTGKYKEQNPISRILIDGFFYGIDEMIRYMNLDPGSRVLESGCGAGLSSLRIKQMLLGQHFEVSDIDDDVISTFDRVRFPIPFRKESVLNLDRRDGEFDCVFLLEVLEHVPEYQKALSEIFRVSSKFVVVSTPNEPLWRILNMLRGKYLQSLGNTPGHINHWSTSSLVQLVSRYGEVLKVNTPTPWTIVLARKVNGR